MILLIDITKNDANYHYKCAELCKEKEEWQRYWAHLDYAVLLGSEEAENTIDNLSKDINYNHMKPDKKLRMYYKWSAFNGSSWATAQLGKYFTSVKNWIEAQKWLNISVNLGSTFGLRELGFLYFRRDDELKDNDRCVKLLEEAGRVGNYGSFIMLAKLYTYNSGLGQDYKKAEYWLQQVLPFNRPMGLYQLGILLAFRQKDVPKAIKCYEECITVTDDDKLKIKCLERLYFSYRYYVEPRDKEKEENINKQGLNLGSVQLATSYAIYHCTYEEGVQILEPFAEKEEVEAITTIGDLHQTNRCSDAVKYYEKAAELGKPTNLARLYWYGIFVEKDVPKAIKLLQEAFDEKYNFMIAGRLLTIYETGFWYGFSTRGHEIEPQLEKFHKLCNDLIDKKIIIGYKRLVNYYFKNKQFKLALEVISKADQDKKRCDFHQILGDIYLEGGEGIEKDVAKSLEYHEKDINRGNYEKVAKIYITGDGVEKDVEKGKKMYEDIFLKKPGPRGWRIIVKFYTDRELVEPDRLRLVELALQISWYDEAYNHLIREKEINPRFLDIVKDFDFTKVSESINPYLILIQSLLKEKVDILDLHFKYSVNGLGFEEAKNDFFGKVCNS